MNGGMATRACEAVILPLETGVAETAGWGSAANHSLCTGMRESSVYLQQKISFCHWKFESHAFRTKYRS